MSITHDGAAIATSATRCSPQAPAPASRVFLHRAHQQQPAACSARAVPRVFFDVKTRTCTRRCRAVSRGC